MAHDRYKASNLRSYNGRFGAHYDSALEVRLFRPERLDDWIVDRIGPGIQGRSILDVGCGTGRLLARFARLGARSLAGADVAETVLAIAARKLHDLQADADLRVADAEAALPWADGSFDAVTLSGVLHHLLHPEAALGEIHRVLRNDGTLLLVDAGFRTPLREIFNLWLRVRPHHGDCRFRGPHQATELLKANAWRIESWGRIRWWSYGLVAVPMPRDG